MCGNDRMVACSDDLLVVSEFFGHLSNGQVVLAQQKISTAPSCEDVLYSECLLRIPTRYPEVSSFGKYIGPFERTGLVRVVDALVVGRAIDALQSEPELRLGVNIAAQSACCEPWWEGIFDCLTSRPSVAERLTFEITETGTFPQPSRAVDFAARIHELGCRIAIDDFGVGRESLANLFDLKPDIVKLDASFLWRARSSIAARGLLKSLILMAKGIGCIVIVEGVETPEDKEIANSLGVGWLQGFYIAKPFLSLDLSAQTSAC